MGSVLENTGLETESGYVNIGNRQIRMGSQKIRLGSYDLIFSSMHAWSQKTIYTCMKIGLIFTCMNIT
jgi:hypothetical protein